MSELKLQQCRLDGRYDVLDCLGRGSYSEVYVARDVAALNGAPRMVVIKALNTNLQGVPDPELERTLIENFRNEAVALDRVRHPNIISRLGATAVPPPPEHPPRGPRGPPAPPPPTRRVFLRTPAADIYSLAKTTYMILTGEAPRRFSQKPITSLPEEFSNNEWSRYVLGVQIGRAHV